MTKPKNQSSPSSASDILHRRYVEGKPGMEALLNEERTNAAIARKIYDLRTKAGLSQRDLAQKVGTTASVICRLEGADYEGHSLNMLQRIAAALDYQIEVRFVKTGRLKTHPTGKINAAAATSPRVSRRG